MCCIFFIHSSVDGHIGCFITFDFSCMSLTWTLGQQHLLDLPRDAIAHALFLKGAKAPCISAYDVALHCPDCPSYSHAEILSLFKA